MEKVDISVNLCTYNRAEILNNTLTSIKNQETRGEFTFEVVVIDDGSTDSTQEILQKVSMNSGVIIRYFREERVGVAAARNRGVVESKGEWIAFIDDDEIAESNWLWELLNAALANGADIVGGALKLSLPVGLESMATGTVRKNLGETTQIGWFQKRFNYPGPGTGNVLVRRNLFEQIGFFDINMKIIGEDQEFFRGARKHGYKTVFTHKGIVHHIIPENRLNNRYLIDKAKQHGKSLAYFDNKEYGYTKTLLICVLRFGHIILKATTTFLKFNYNDNIMFNLKCSFCTAIEYCKATFNIGFKRLYYIFK